MGELSIREWQQRYRAGDFRSPDVDVQREAGWCSWFCRNDVLAKRLKKLAGAVMGVKAPFLLDNYCVLFVNDRPPHGIVYDKVYFEPLSDGPDGRRFFVSLDYPQELSKWTLFTQRYGYDAPEFCCGQVREMASYLNGIASELEVGLEPGFVTEKRAIAAYVRQREGQAPACVRREEEHVFSYRSARDGRYRSVFAAAAPEKLPAGSPADQTEQWGDLYLCVSQTPALDVGGYLGQQAQKQKRRERER